MQPLGERSEYENIRAQLGAQLHEAYVGEGATVSNDATGDRAHPGGSPSALRPGQPLTVKLRLLLKKYRGGTMRREGVGANT